MADYLPEGLADLEGNAPVTHHAEQTQPAPTAETAAPVPQNEPTESPPVVGHDGAQTNGTASWHAEAGRKGALRIRQLIQQGRLYEQERGLTGGRQRLRQLIEEGKLYEQEHGLHPAKKARRERPTRLGRQQLLRTLLHCVLRLARPSFRPQIARLIEALEAEGN